ncbi:MAG: 50S ribosomal protein L4 [Candidatus Omnitrophica bacterium]|nr:50S ribosomal protein L4 [Candidatus Omnitrophota bacterium]MCB9720688.1 50S ribosomal protein L4 [Candidatus Omnitrophota bacterium]
MAKLAIYNKEGQESGSIELPEEIFGSHVNQDVIHQAVVMYQASLRQGNASTKTRGDRNGGGKKPFRQKGTGRARAGSSRSPLWKGGGIVFGPHPRDFGYSVPKKVRLLALAESLKVRHKESRLLCVEDLTAELSKTKDFAAILSNLKMDGKIVAALEGSNDTVRRVSRNIRSFDLVRSQDMNALDVLKHKFVLVSKTAMTDLIQRVKGETQATAKQEAA